MVQAQWFLALLRAQYHNYQESHWTAVGGNYYGNHLLFQRLYEGVQEEVDSVAEKSLALFPEVIDTGKLQKMMCYWLERWRGISCPFHRGLMSEKDLQNVAKALYQSLEDAGMLSMGWDDMLMALANDHETNTYLLQQVTRGMHGMEE